jgi:hypothetical protein
MTITATIQKTDGPPSSFATVLGTTTLAEPAAWTRVTALNDLVPSGGARLVISSDSAAFRFAIMPPRSAQQTGEADNPPPHSGRLCNLIGHNYGDRIPRGSQVWVKQA